MKKNVLKLIDDFFYSDLDIQIGIKKNRTKKNKNNILILESDAYYVNGARHNGIVRTIDMPNVADDQIYEDISDLCGVELNEEDLKYSLSEIEKRGYVLS